MTGTREAYKAIWRELGQQLSFEGGPLTSAQQGYLPHALDAITGGPPDVLYAQAGNGDEVLCTLFWTQGSTFGKLDVRASDQDYPGVPVTDGWLRPVSELSRVDLRVVVEPDRTVLSEVDIYYDATLNWRDGYTPVRLDGTFSGNHYARVAANALIRAVLDHVDNATKERGIPRDVAGS